MSARPAPSGPVAALLQEHRLPALVVAIVIVMAAITVLERGAPDEFAAEGTVALGGFVGGAAPRVNELAPDFSLPALDGGEIALSGLRGHPVVLNFWATWCPPCRGEMPELQRIAEAHRGEGLVVLGVDLQEDPSVVERYASTLGVTYTLVVDRSGAVATRYNLTGLPTSYFIDREGTVRDRYIGPLTSKGLAAKLASIVPLATEVRK